MAVDYEIDLDALLITHHGDPLGTIPLLGYIRVSTAREDMISPEMQAEAVDGWAKSRGRRIVAWYADLDLSGRTLAKRQISGIIDAVADRSAPERAVEVGVRTFDRFGRNRGDNAMNLSRLERAGGALLSATEQVDAKTAIGKFSRGMLFEVAALKSDLIGEGWKEVQAYRIARGLPHTGGPRWGYDRLGKIRVGDTWITDPADPEERYALGDVSPQHARAALEAAEGAPMGGIARWLNRAGVPSAVGNTGGWVVQSLYQVLDSGFGFGYLIAHDPKCETHDLDDTGKCRNRRQFDGAHPHVFDDDDERDAAWEAYTARRARGRQVGRRAANARYDFTTVITCRWCDRHLNAQPYHGRPWLLPQWRCMPDKLAGCPRPDDHAGTSVAGGRLLYAVWSLLTRERERLTDITTAAGTHQADTPVGHTLADQVQDLQAKIAATRRKVDGLTERFAEGDIPADSYRRTLAKYQAEEAGHAEALTAAKAEAARGTRTPQEQVVVVRELLDEWPTLPVWTRNKLLRELLTITAWRVDDATAWARIRTGWGTEEVAQVAGRLTAEERETLQKAGLIT